ncbi:MULTISPECIES: SHOCT domain-containing protein [Christiangramia]|nr:SHOCT domain-containing protein [Christiangramia flava]
MMMYWWILIGAVVLAAILLPVSRWKTKNENNLEEPLQILKKRYAKGEISKDEFEEQKIILKKNRS